MYGGSRGEATNEVSMKQLATNDKMRVCRCGALITTKHMRLSYFCGSCDSRYRMQQHVDPGYGRSLVEELLIDLSDLFKEHLDCGGKGVVLA